MERSAEYTKYKQRKGAYIRNALLFFTTATVGLLYLRSKLPNTHSLAETSDPTETPKHFQTGVEISKPSSTEIPTATENPATPTITAFNKLPYTLQPQLDTFIPIDAKLMDLDFGWDTILSGEYIEQFKSKGLDRMTVMCTGDETYKMTFQMALTLSGKQSGKRSDEEVYISSDLVSKMMNEIGIDFPDNGMVRVNENSVFWKIFFLNGLNTGELKMCNILNPETNKIEPIFMAKAEWSNSQSG